MAYSHVFSSAGSNLWLTFPPVNQNGCLTQPHARESCRLARVSTSRCQVWRPKANTSAQSGIFLNKLWLMCTVLRCSAHGAPQTSVMTPRPHLGRLLEIPSTFCLSRGTIWLRKEVYSNSSVCLKQSEVKAEIKMCLFLFCFHFQLAGVWARGLWWGENRGSSPADKARILWRLNYYAMFDSVSSLCETFPINLMSCFKTWTVNMSPVTPWGRWVDWMGKRTDYIFVKQQEQKHNFSNIIWYLCRLDGGVERITFLGTVQDRIAGFSL